MPAAPGDAKNAFMPSPLFKELTLFPESDWGWPEILGTMSPHVQSCARLFRVCPSFKHSATLIHELSKHLCHFTVSISNSALSPKSHAKILQTVCQNLGYGKCLLYEKRLNNYSVQFTRPIACHPRVQPCAGLCGATESWNPMLLVQSQGLMLALWMAVGGVTSPSSLTFPWPHLL